MEKSNSLNQNSMIDSEIGFIAKEIQGKIPSVLMNGIFSSETRDNQQFLLVDKSIFTSLATTFSKNPGTHLISLHASDERELHEGYRLYVIFSFLSNKIITIATDLDPNTPSYKSLTPFIFAANWYEREIREMFGIEPIGHPDLRPLILYDDWPENEYPLRKDFALNSDIPRVPVAYPFKHMKGDGIFEIPVGPVHAGIIEPGHFRFSVAGEPILNLEIRLGYVHKGIEKLSESMPYRKGIFLAERISGDNSYSHSTAYCQAIEKMAEIEIPERAKFLRTIYLELERLYNLCRDVAGIALVTAHNVGAANAYIIQEQIMQLNECLTGSRLLRGVNALGGVRYDISEHNAAKIHDTLTLIKSELDDFYHIIDIPSVMDRTQNTGIISKKIALDLNLVGPVARASGIDHDVRKDHPYAAYSSIDFSVVTEQTGDVQGRLMVKIGEIYQSLKIIEQALNIMPSSAITMEIVEITKEKIGFSLVETPRGEALHWILGGEGKPYRHKIRDPSYYNWLAMEQAVLGNIVPDFPLINKSMNLSYSGNDL